jgi:hypothetical protein
MDIGAGHPAVKEEPVSAPELRTLSPEGLDALKEMANKVCTKVLGPNWDKRKGLKEFRKALCYDT